MSHLDILLPFGLLPAELSADLLRELHLPALALLTARAASERAAVTTDHDFLRALPHERWLASRFGLSESRNSSPPIASALMQSLDLQAPAGTWFVLQPVHIHIARDHLVLTDPRQLPLDEEEARALFDIAKPLFEETGRELLFGNARTWFVRADDWHAVQTATPDAAAGHNIDIWMPKGPGERDWRKVQNEVQMHWFAHPLNAEREARGQKPVNSLWLWGGAAAELPVRHEYTHAFNLRDWMAGFGQFISQRVPDASAAEVIAVAPQNGLLVLDTLLAPALSNDWGSWLERMRRLESGWFAPLLDAIRAGSLDRISLTLTNDVHTSRLTITRSSLRKFWIKPSLAALCP